MTGSLVYNIPASRVHAYQGRSVIVRSSAPQEIVERLTATPADVRFIQLSSMPAHTEVLEAFGEGTPIEIVLNEPADEYPGLYHYTNLLDTHPVRAAVPVVAGFSKAVKLAVSLDFAVKLEVRQQPEESLLRELEAVADLYLHRSSVRQPIEFFHTVLLSFYRHEPVSLWEVAEEDPAVVRYVADDGKEDIPRRVEGFDLHGELDSFVVRQGQQLLSEKRECGDCEFFSRCGGYFKWPDKTYACDGVRRLFRTLENAAAELERDISEYEAREARRS